MGPPYALVVEAVVGVELVHAVSTSHSKVVSWYLRVGGNLGSFPSQSRRFSHDLLQPRLDCGQHMDWLIILPCCEVKVLSKPLHTLYDPLNLFPTSSLGKDPGFRQPLAVNLDCTDGEDLLLPT